MINNIMLLFAKVDAHFVETKHIIIKQETFST